MYRKILLAYDGSEFSRTALDHAVNLAVQCRADLNIISVVPKITMPLFPDGGPSPIAAPRKLDYQDTIKEMYSKSLREAEHDVKEKYPDLSVSSRLLEGKPSSTIVEEAEKDGADLIVIGSRGLGGITGWILGSTSRRVVESCSKPVLVVKSL
jgi:nucleotide-binding universal stress UspA family protein